MRDTIRLLQDTRKKAGLAICDRIHIGIQTSNDLRDILTAHLENIKDEVLATDIVFEALPAPQYREQIKKGEITRMCWMSDDAESSIDAGQNTPSLSSHCIWRHS